MPSASPPPASSAWAAPPSPPPSSWVLRNRNKLETLVINAAECEPYLTCDDRMMRERSEAVIDGIRILRHALGVDRAIIAIEGNKPEALAALKAVCSANQFRDVLIARVPTRYPMGSEKHLVQTLTGKETPARALTADIGVVVHNVATCYAIREAVRFGRPLISRIVTVSGGAMKRTGNFEVPIGTPISHLIDHCGGFNKEPDRLLLGGPMMGPADCLDPHLHRQGQQRRPCPRPRRDAGAPGDALHPLRLLRFPPAPGGLTPFEMAGHIRKEELDASVKIGLLDCIACGSCAWVCPASIPLVQYFNYAKGKLTAQQRAKHKQEETKRLTQFREERMERQKKAKQEAMARLKAEREAKKKAEEEKKRAKQETIGA